MATSAGSTPLIEDSHEDLEGREPSENITGNSLFENQDQEKSEKTPLSVKRRIALVGALLLCVFTVFAFAFLLPCHKQRCQKVSVCPGKGGLMSVNWTANFGGIVPGLASMVDTSGYQSSDIIVEFGIEEGEARNSSFLRQICEGRDCRGSGVLAIDPSCGTKLWVFNGNTSLSPLICEVVPGKTGTIGGRCLLVEEKAKLVLLNTSNGTKKWEIESKAGQKIAAFNFIKDIDGDEVREVVFVHELGVDNNGSCLNLLSGKTGKAIGQHVPLPGKQNGGAILEVHSLSDDKQFLIVGSKSAKNNTTSLWAISLHDLLQKVRNTTARIPGMPWGSHRPDITGFIPIFKDTVIPLPPLLVNLDSDNVKDVVLLVKKDGISLLALNGHNLDILWNVTIQSAVSIDKLFQAHYSAEGNSTDVALLVKYENTSSSLVVVNGLTGKIRWSFQSKTGFPVAPVPLPRLRQAFVVWLSTVEALKLISRPSDSRQVQPNGGKQQNLMEYTRGKTRKLLWAASKAWNRGKPNARDSLNSEFSSKWFHHFWKEQRADDDDDDESDYDNNDDDDFTNNKDTDDKMKRFNLDSNEEVERKEAKGFLVALLKAFKARDKNIKNMKTMPSPRNDYVQVLLRGYNKESLSDPKKSSQLFHAEKGIHKQKTGERKKLSKHNYDDLEKDLRDLKKREYDGHYINGQEVQMIVGSKIKEDGKSGVARHGEGFMKKHDKLYSLMKSQTAAPEDLLSHEEEEFLNYPKKGEISSSGKKGKARVGLKDTQEDKKISELTPIQKNQSAVKNAVRKSYEDILQTLFARDAFQRKQFPNDKRHSSNLGLLDKPSLHKRSVASLQYGSQCIGTSDDDVDSYVAVLIVTDTEERQHVMKIATERPLYLDAEEYQSLFNSRKGNSTSCLRLIPSLKSEPLLRESKEGLDLVYTVSFVSEGNTVHHVGKVRKMSLSQVLQKMKGLKIDTVFDKHRSKRESDYSISFPRIL